MKITVSQNYILGLKDVRQMGAVSFKVLRFILSKDLPLYEKRKTISAQDLSRNLGTSIKILYNKHAFIQNDLENYKNGSLIQSVTYNHGEYVFYLGPDASKLYQPSSNFIQYDSEILTHLTKTYSICLYEQIRLAMLTSPTPVITLRAEDMVAGSSSSTIYNYRASIANAIEEINQTDIEVAKLERSTVRKTFTLYCRKKVGYVPASLLSESEQGVSND